MRQHITTKFNYVFENYGETNDLPSVTIPGDSMSLKEMLDRFARGLALPEPRQIPYYNENEVFPNLRSMDLTEQADYMENVTLQATALQSDYEELIQSSKKDAGAPSSPAPDPNKQD